MLAAYRARLADGTSSTYRHSTVMTPMSPTAHVGRPPAPHPPSPTSSPWRQTWTWCFIPDGRVVLVADPGPTCALPTLPGGTVEGTDTGPEDTLHQEAAEEAQLTLTEPVLLAHPHPGSRAPGLGRQERGKPNSPLKQPVPAGACPPLRGGVGTAP